MNDPALADDEERREWASANFDPETFSTDAVNATIGRVLEPGGWREGGAEER